MSNFEAPRASTTPTGIEIAHCDICGLSHPVTRRHCAWCKAPSLFLAPDTGLCNVCRKIDAEELAAEQRQDFNAAVWASYVQGVRRAHGFTGDVLDDALSSCPCCTRGYGIECNTHEAWCEACGWHCDATDAPFLHSLVYAAHLRRRERIGKLLRAAGVLPEPHTDE